MRRSWLGRHTDAPRLRYVEEVRGLLTRLVVLGAVVASACSLPADAVGFASADRPVPAPTNAVGHGGDASAATVVTVAAPSQPTVFESVSPPQEPVPSKHGPMLPREVVLQDHAPFATVGPVTLVHPSASVEVIGFHESNHDGAQQMEALPTAVAPFVMASRERGTGSATAADVVVEPGVPIVSPVTGVVLRAGSYVLYCDHADHFVVIEPADRPGWEVKMLHFLDLQVSAGTPVEAGSTVVGSGPRPLAFRSQVDDATAAPSWPHVHIEVVDPSIPDRPSASSC